MPLRVPRSIVSNTRVVPMQLDPTRPNVALIARTLADPARSCPCPRAGARARRSVAVYVSEAMLDLYGARAGQLLVADDRRATASMSMCAACGATTRAARRGGARQLADFERLTGDDRINDLACGEPGADAGRGAGEIRRWSGRKLLEFALPGEIRAASLRISIQLRGDLLAAGDGDRHRAGRRCGQLLGAGARASQGVRPAARISAHARARTSRSCRRGRGLDRRRRFSACCSAWR